MVLPEEKKTDFVCDDSLAQDGDACDTPGEEACSIDQTELLTCKSNKFVKDHACPGGCSFDERKERFRCVIDLPTDASGKPTTKASASVAAKTATGKPTVKLVSSAQLAAKAKAKAH